MATLNLTDVPPPTDAEKTLQAEIAVFVTGLRNQGFDSETIARELQIFGKTLSFAQSFLDSQ